MVSSSWVTLLLWAGYAGAVGLTAAIAAYALTRQAGRVADLFGATMVALLVWSFGAFGATSRPKAPNDHASSATIVAPKRSATRPARRVSA